MTKILRILNYVTLAMCIVFSFLQISTIVDLSFSALWISLAFTGVLVYFGFYRMVLRKDYQVYRIVNKLYEYVPFVFITAFVLRRAGTFSTSFGYDVISVILWLIITGLSFTISRFYMSDKYFYKKNPDIPKPEEHKKNIGNKVGRETFEWIDAFVQAVFTIILLNVFIFQLYEIPSESMVNQFLIGDRVLVFKVSSGPKFPMTKVGLKNIKKYKRGDITVFHNPHYPANRKNELRNFYSQLVFMLTLTKVNLNVDSDGKPIADPLVKRVCGVGGEQLCMLDGVLYHRTPLSDEFTAVAEDAEWAKWNLNDIPEKDKKKVQTAPLATTPLRSLDDSQKNRAWAEQQYAFDTLVRAEQERKDFDVSKYRAECQVLAATFEKLARSYSSAPFVSASDRSGSTLNLFTDDERNVFSIFSELMSENPGDIAYLKRILGSRYGISWFNAFMTDWLTYCSEGVKSGNELYGSDMYSDSLFRMNLMIKRAFARLVIRDLELLLQNASPAAIAGDVNRTVLISQVSPLLVYMSTNDSRNMMVFPANNEDGTPNYIPEGSYFMMGDNRFNSLDMRHSYTSIVTPLVAKDRTSLTYQSMLAPQYVSHERMMGTPCYRFWPLNRTGIIRLK